MSLSLPAVLEKDGKLRVANTANDYWTLKYQGFNTVEGVEPEAVGLSPQQKGARTRAANRAQEEQDSSSEGETAVAGTASDGGDLSNAGDPAQTA